MNEPKTLDDLLESLARLGRAAVDLRSPPQPVPIVGDPGWIPGQPEPSRQTVTELVTALQRRYPDDAELRALVSRLTDMQAQLRQDGERTGKAIGEANGLRATVERLEMKLGVIRHALEVAKAEDGDKPLDNDAIRAALALGDDDLARRPYWTASAVGW